MPSKGRPQGTVRSAVLMLLLALAPASAGAEDGDHLSLKEAVQTAILRNPEVRARWHAFREATEEIGVAKGGFLPRVDLSAGVGRERLTPSTVGADTNYTRHDTLINLRQMVFDGFATSSEVKRLGKAKLVRYFELLDASENTALEAGRAYLDVVRFRRQTYLAEENYIQHQAAYEQLKRRAESGVGKRVDVDQAASRLALADVNLTTALANLHDVTARYLRIVGEPPARVMFAPPDLTTSFPERADAALSLALRSNPALRATVENVEASQYDLEVRRAAFSPRVELVARQENINNYLGTDASRDNSVVEMRIFYNLFNGGSDIARDRQYRERKNIALDLREKACRDIRQTLSIAYHDTLRLSDQLTFLALQVDLVEKTRNAYRDQFNIGQRTLLDLLNTQNEFFDARRSQVNADVDLALAYLRSYAGMGRLLEKLGLKRMEADGAPEEKDMAAVDLAQLCPPTAPAEIRPDRAKLGRKAREMMEGSSNSFIGARNPLAAPFPPDTTARPLANPAAPVAGDPSR
ncbi:TolC family outer membrane protein [Accumulibacter sp.]|uniref:TolC family outer membrane protein n=1 Tax=Candidatus Accumulibacter proximus TaxID=2954385 RepID=A0A935UFM8_9PROT|nr:TolC family outer membrane protein [Accumulibacter sp.]MBK7675171.1 TolC family outer membrane protein [Candidatus Accumulibacter proximus]MBL8375285.1 TolC family outer membrane protein [Accumulibacter sp.]